MTLPAMRERWLTVTHWITLGIGCVAGLAGLFFVWVEWFNKGRIPKVLTARNAHDGLIISALAILVVLYVHLRPAIIRATAPRARRFDWRVMIPLAGLIFLAAFLRFTHLGAQSLWRDEIASVARVESATLSQALTLGNFQDAWPSYHIPVYLFVRLAGDTEFAFRFPSALAGILLIPVIFVLGRRMFSARDGLIAAGMAAVMRAPLWYSQEMRSYAFLTLFAALSGYFWFRMAQDFVWRGKPSRFALTGTMLSAILTIYAHYFGLVLIAAEGLGALILAIHLRRLPLSLVAVYAGIGLSYLPWLPLLVNDLGKPEFWAGKPSWFGGRLFGFLTFLFRYPLNFIVLGLIGISIAALLWRSFRRHGEERALPLVVTPGVALAAWLIVPYGIAYWRSVTAAPILVDRYLLVLLPPVYLLAARAITRLPIPKIGQGVVGAGIVAFFVIRLATGGFYTEPHKTQLREAVQSITSRESQYPDAVIIAGYQGGQKELDYYFRKFGSSSTIDIKAGNAWEIDDTRAQIAARKPKYIWFIGQHLFYEKEFQDFLDQDYKRVSETRFWHVGVWLYENPDAEN